MKRKSILRFILLPLEGYFIYLSLIIPIILLYFKNISLDQVLSVLLIIYTFSFHLFLLFVNLFFGLFEGISDNIRFLLIPLAIMGIGVSFAIIPFILWLKNKLFSEHIFSHYQMPQILLILSA